MPLSDTERGWGEVLQTFLYIQNNIQAYACTRCFAHPKSENSWRHLWLVLMKEIEGAASHFQFAITRAQFAINTPQLKLGA